MLGSSESAKNGMMDEMDAVATESMCQVGAISYRAGFAVKLREIQGQGMEIDVGGDDPQDCELSPVPASAGQMLHEEGGEEESACTEDEPVEPKEKKQKNEKNETPKPKDKKQTPKPKPKPRPKDKKNDKKEKKTKKTEKSKTKKNGKNKKKWLSRASFVCYSLFGLALDCN